MANDDEPETGQLTPIETERLERLADLNNRELKGKINVDLKTTIKTTVKTEGQAMTSGQQMGGSQQSQQPQQEQGEQDRRQQPGEKKPKEERQPAENKGEPEEDKKDKEPDQPQPDQDDDDEDENEKDKQTAEKCYKCGNDLGVLGQCVTCGKIPDDCSCQRNEENRDKEEDKDKDKDKEGEERPEGEDAPGAGPAAAEGGADALAGAGAAEGGAAVTAGTAAGAEVGAAAAGSGILASAPIWATALVILLGIGFFLFVILAVPVAVCKSSYFDGVGTAGAKAAFTASGICSAFNGGSTGSVSNRYGPSSQGKLTDAAARQLLSQARITVNHLQPQTSLEQIEQTTIAEVITLKANCTAWAQATGKGNICNIQVTGGTESGAGHVETGSCSHINGQKIDVTGLDPLLDQYINANFGPPSGHRSNGDALYTVNGKEYAREFDHWDIAVCLG